MIDELKGAETDKSLVYAENIVKNLHPAWASLLKTPTEKISNPQTRNLQAKMINKVKQIAKQFEIASR